MRSVYARRPRSHHTLTIEYGSHRKPTFDMRTDLELDQILPDPDNVRKVFTRIESLAKTIKEYGLLHNLVVRPAIEPGKFFIVAGERRWRAIRLLAERGEWVDTVPVLIITSNGKLEQLIENEARSEIPIWHLGYRYLEMHESGFSQAEIAAALQSSTHTVNTAIKLARGLAPRVVRALDNIGAGVLTTYQILSIANLIDRQFFEPDEAAQMKELERMLASPKRKKRTCRDAIPRRERVWMRYKSLEQRHQMRIRPELLPFVEAIVRYLDGRDPRLTLPELPGER